MAKLGIDVSAHQGNINLAALKDEIDFVIIRVGFGVSGTLDTKFKRNVDLCKSLGIPFGFYWYSYALNEAGAEAEANAFLRAIEPYKNDYSYGCWFDMEDADGYKRKKGMPSNRMLRKICEKFCSIVENAGYYVGIYASSSWFNNQLKGEELNKYDKWVAQWPTSGGKQKGLAVKPESRDNLNLWQFTSDAYFNGYNGRLDADYAYRDYPAIIKGLRIETPIEEEKKPEIEIKSIEQIAKEVIDGLWGNGAERVEKLIAAGYNANEIQKKVNELLTPKKEGNNNITYYVIQRGDNLSKIARKYKTTWQKIYNDNKDIIIQPNKIYIGQKIKIIL